MANVKSVRALDRGLSVLETLKKRGATLGELHGATGLPRATLLRLLKTLEERHWIFCVPGEGIYQLGARSHYRPTATSTDNASTEMARLASPILDRLCKKTLWPCGLAVRNGHTMLILETERQSSPFTVDRTIIGHRPSLLKSATGRAYLAFCPQSEREQILAVLRKSGHPDDNLANMPRLVERQIEETRKRGYGIRELARRTRISNSDQTFNAIAVPVMNGDIVVAAINALWIENLISVSAFVAKHLPALQDAARDLGRLVAKRGPRR